jgi:hypothetical protein
MGRRGGDLRAVDREDPDLHESGARTQREHSAEELRERLLVTGAKARDRRVIWDLVGGDHAEGDVV